MKYQIKVRYRHSAVVVEAEPVGFRAPSVTLEIREKQEMLIPGNEWGVISVNSNCVGSIPIENMLVFAEAISLAHKAMMKLAKRLPPPDVYRRKLYNGEYNDG